jgi:hypothetical protein
LIFQRTFKKIPVPKVLNWDSYGDPEENIVNIDRNRRCIELLDQQKTEMIRIPLHPRDPHNALEDCCMLRNIAIIIIHLKAHSK